MNTPLVNSLYTDYKVEVIAAEILEKSNDLSSIVIKRMPGVERPHTKDLQQVYNDTSAYDFSEIWLLETCREGLYETLPQNLFHEPTLGTIHSTEQDILLQIQQQRREEENARNFFGPFEQELTYLNVRMYALEKSICRTDSDAVIQIFSRAWPFLNRIDPHSARVFIHILPFLHRVKGDFHWMEQYISLFTGLPVAISQYPRMLEPVANKEYYTLGEQSLGETMLLHGNAYDGETDLQIRIGPVPAHLMINYLPGSAFNSILDELYQHFVPFNKSYRQVVFAEAEARDFILDDQVHSALGYNAFL
jgi:hypothetical protein